jgi:elongation factor P--beta-lysine ligase
MLEFYQAYSDYHELMVMTEEMLSTCAREAIGTDQITFRRHRSRSRRRTAACRCARRRVTASERLGTSVTTTTSRAGDGAGPGAQLHIELLPSWGPERLRPRSSSG